VTTVTSPTFYQIFSEILIFSYNLAGKGASIWDTYIHKNPNITVDGSNADVAADSYHQYKQDVAALQMLGVSRVLVCFSDLIPNLKLYSIIMFVCTDVYVCLVTPTCKTLY
jgi:hypothetical protein